jgi:hypothetical protein
MRHSRWQSTLVVARMALVQFRSWLGAVALALLVTGVASAEGAPLHMSIEVGALGTLDARKPLLERRVELGLGSLPDFLRREPTRSHESCGALLPSEPVWLRLRIVPLDRLALHVDGFAAPALALVPLDEVTRQLQALDVVGITGILPILEPVRVITGVLTSQANELIGRRMSVELGDRVETRYTALHGLAGTIQRGQYLRTDDVTGRQFNFDVRLVLAWRPNDTIRLEAGYAVAYLSGEGRIDFGPTGPTTNDHTSSYLVHGPCATINFDF